MSGCERVNGSGNACKAELAPASPKLRDAVWGNGNIPHIVFSFLELAKENSTVAQVSKKCHAVAIAQYARTTSLDINWVHNRYQEPQYREVLTRLLNAQICPQLRAIKVPNGLWYRWSDIEGGVLPVRLPQPRYQCFFLMLPQQLQVLDLRPSSPWRFHDLFLLGGQAEPLLTEKPALKKLFTTGELVDWSVDQIVKLFPGLEELHVNGLFDLEHLLRKCATLKSLSNLVLDCGNMLTGFLRDNWSPEALASVPECPSVRTVSFCRNSVSNTSSNLVKLLISKLPNLERLEISYTSFAADPVLDVIFATAKRQFDTVVSVSVEKEELTAARQKLKQVPNCFSADAQKALQRLFAPAKQEPKALTGLEEPKKE